MSGSGSVTAASVLVVERIERQKRYSKEDALAPYRQKNNNYLKDLKLVR